MPIAASKTSTVGSVFAFVIRFVILERLRGTAMEGCRPERQSDGIRRVRG
jgi:hypothetical protein